MKKLLDFDNLVVDAIDYDTGTLVSKYVSELNPPGPHVGNKLLEGNQTHHVLTTGQTLIHDDLLTNPQFGSNRGYSDQRLRYSIMVPLVSSGRNVGVLSLHSHRIGAYALRERYVPHLNA